MAAASVPSTGQVIAGRFRVEGELGRGGMGVVLRGRDPNSRGVAIKVLLPEAVGQLEAVGRFVNEARAARELTSDHAVRVLEAGTLESGLPFMVMELLEGEDLATMLERRGPFAVPTACDAIIEACDALAEAHARGMVHRDLKPANLFAARGSDGRTRVKVLDFGVSKIAVQLRHAALTSTGTTLGTPHYMAPEQLKSAKGADARADVWSLGVVLYELLSGKLPFDGRSFGILFTQILSEDPPAVASIRPDVPRALSDVVTRCLRKNRDDRYPDLVALVSALMPFTSPSGAAAARRITDTHGGARASQDNLAAPSGLGGTLLMPNAASSSGRLSAPVATAAHPWSASQLPVPPGSLAARPSSPSAPGIQPMPPPPQAQPPTQSAGSRGLVMLFVIGILVLVAGGGVIAWIAMHR